MKCYHSSSTLVYLTTNSNFSRLVSDDDTMRTLFDAVLVTCFVVILLSYLILKFEDNESFKRRYVLAQEETLELVRSSKRTPGKIQGSLN